MHDITSKAIRLLIIINYIQWTYKLVYLHVLFDQECSLSEVLRV